MNDDFEVVPIGERCAKDKRIQELEALVDKLRIEARGHAQEARSQRSTVLAIYQSLGIQKGDWNGAGVVLEKIKIHTLKAQARELDKMIGIAETMLARNVQSVLIRAKQRLGWLRNKAQGIDDGFIGMHHL